MTFWITFAGLSILAMLTVLRPLLRQRREEVPRNTYDLNVYKDQLAEINRDLDRSLLSPEEAESAKVEISRRILGASAQTQTENSEKQSKARPYIWAALTVCIPILVFIVYMLSGSPGLRDMPLVARLNVPTEQQDMSVLISQVEDRLRQNPDDGRGWEVIAPIYRRLQQYEKAVEAYGNAIRLNGASAEKLIGLGQSIVMSNQGMVSEEARVAFDEALKFDPDAVTPRIFIAVDHRQEGDIEEAMAIWRKLLAEAGGESNAPWIEIANQEVDILKQMSEQTNKTFQLVGPSEEEIEAAEEMSVGDRKSMIVGMVEGLNDRLSEEGGTVEEWKRLINSLVVLGRYDEADSAVERALAAFSGKESERNSIIEAARNSGLTPPTVEN